MKIGIMTFWWSQDNYGQLLQAYALQKFLNDNGHNAFIIKYKYARDRKLNKSLSRVLKIFNPHAVFSHLKRKLIIEKNASINMRYNRDFDSFRKRYFKFSQEAYSTIEQLRDNPPVCEAYICGSDQIWNFHYLDEYSDDVDAYTLNFGERDVLRIAYAPSVASRTLKKFVEKKFRENLDAFDSISLREEGSINLIRGLCKLPIEVVPDPTLLLDKETYNGLISLSSCTPSTFLYFLGNMSMLDPDRIYDMISQNDENIVYVNSQTDKMGKGTDFLSIENWIKNIREARLVVTNSFHGVVFSVLFNRPFYVIPLKGEFEVMNTRIVSFLSILGLRHRIIENYEQIFQSEPIDWIFVNNTLSLFIEKGKNYLLNSLNAK